MHGIAETAPRLQPPVRGDERAGAGASLFGAALAGVIAVPLIGLALIARGTAADVADETAQIRERVDYAIATATAPAAALRALADERAAATAWVTGVADPPDMGTPDNGQAREAVDDALATLRADLARQEEGTLADSFRFPLELTDGLGDLRAAVDEASDAQRAPDSELVATTVDGYTRVISTLAAAWERETLWLADPDLRQGARLTSMAVQQSSLAADLTRAMARGSSSDEVFETVLAELIVWPEDLRDGNALIDDTAGGVYAPFAEALLSDSHVTVLPDLADEAIASRQVDVDAVLDAAGLAGDNSAYAEFERDVNAAFHARADEVVAAAESRERRYLGGALVTILAAASAIAVMLVLLVLALVRRG